MRIPLPKLKAMILFFCKYTDGRLLGKVKLMKLFYFADFGHVKQYGSPITWDTYVNLEHGPIPSAIMNLVNTAAEDVDNSALSDTIKIEKNADGYLQRIVPIKDITERDTKYFSETELEILEKVCSIFFDKNARNIEDASHKEAPWRQTSFSEVISYSLAAQDSDCVVKKEEIDLLVNIAGC